MPRSLHAVAVFLVLGFLVTSCAEEPSSTTPTATASITVVPRTSTLPPRPSTIPVAKTDPCEWLNPTDHPELKIDAPARPHQDDSVVKATQCAWSANGADYRLGYSTTKGVEFWLTPGAPVETTIGTVAAFPAVQVRHKALERCDVAVDVGPQQQVIATVTLSLGFEDKFPPYCESAEKMAESAMRALGAK